MKKTALIVMLLAAGLSMGCDTRPNPGVELGNPNIGVKSLKVTTQDAVYDFVFIDDTSVAVSRTTAAGASTVVTEYVRGREYLNLEAAFEDLQRIELYTVHDAYGNVTSGIFKIDGEVIKASFATDDGTDDAETPSPSSGEVPNPTPRNSLPVAVPLPSEGPRENPIPRETIPSDVLSDPQETGVYGAIDVVPVKDRKFGSDF